MKDAASTPDIVRCDDPAQLPHAAWETLCLAFAEDPHFHWLAEHDSLSELFALLLQTCAGRGEIHMSANGKAVAIWYPPASWPLPPSGQARFFFRYMMLVGVAKAATRGLGLLRMESRHPGVRHGYLQTIGVHPDYQGRGYGSALLRPLLARCDRENTPMYLETSLESNLPFYARHGFQTQRIDNLPGGLRLWSLLRSPAKP